MFNPISSNSECNFSPFTVIVHYPTCMTKRNGWYNRWFEMERTEKTPVNKKGDNAASTGRDK